MAFTNQTVTYSETSKGFPSFYSFIPEQIKGMNGYLYTFYQVNYGNIIQVPLSETLFMVVLLALLLQVSLINHLWKINYLKP
tara:strand:+ start:1204 stop:1449 length:246 start_codon:yes stop_codon:yes gene_type:complete